MGTGYLAHSENVTKRLQAAVNTGPWDVPESVAGGKILQKLQFRDLVSIGAALPSGVFSHGSIMLRRNVLARAESEMPAREREMRS